MCICTLKFSLNVAEKEFLEIIIIITATVMV